VQSFAALNNSNASALIDILASFYPSLSRIASSDAFGSSLSITAGNVSVSSSNTSSVSNITGGSSHSNSSDSETNSTTGSYGYAGTSAFDEAEGDATTTGKNGVDSNAGGDSSGISQTNPPPSSGPPPPTPPPKTPGCPVCSCNTTLDIFNCTLPDLDFTLDCDCASTVSGTLPPNSGSA
jgi:hypothetical protein